MGFECGHSRYALAVKARYLKNSRRAKMKKRMIKQTMA